MAANVAHTASNQDVHITNLLNNLGEMLTESLQKI